MAEIIRMPSKAEAIAKLDKELSEFKGDKYAKVIYEHVCSVLKHFCEQNEMFALVVCQTKRTLSDVCYEILQETVKSRGTHLSDIDTYRMAVRNYFPTAEINFKMVLEVGEMPLTKEVERLTEYPPEPERKPYVPPVIKELTPEEKLQREVEAKARKEAEEQRKQEEKLKKRLAEEKKHNEEMGQIFLFDL